MPPNDFQLEKPYVSVCFPSRVSLSVTPKIPPNRQTLIETWNMELFRTESSALKGIPWRTNVVCDAGGLQQLDDIEQLSVSPTVQRLVAITTYSIDKSTGVSTIDQTTRISGMG